MNLKFFIIFLTSLLTLTACVSTSSVQQNPIVKTESVTETFPEKMTSDGGIEQRKVELSERLKIIQEKHFKGIYSDEDFIHLKKEIDQELANLLKASGAAPLGR